MASWQDTGLFETPRPPAQPARWWNRPLPLPLWVVGLVAWSWLAYRLLGVLVGWLV